MLLGRTAYEMRRRVHCLGRQGVSLTSLQPVSKRILLLRGINIGPNRRVAMPKLREALALWRGPPLADLGFEPFALQYLWHRGVTISILSANDASWSARAAHVNRPGRSCVIWVGPVDKRPETDAQKRSSDRPNVPVCDD